MTDNEIIKALEYCLTNEDCRLCPSFHKCPTSFKLEQYALDLINRQQAEIERLQSMNQSKLDTIHDLQTEIEQLEKDKEKFAISYANAVARNLTIKAEAIKEFAERLKNECAFECDVSLGYGRPCYEDAIPIIAIDNLVKEMVGENE